MRLVIFINSQEKEVKSRITIFLVVIRRIAFICNTFDSNKSYLVIQTNGKTDIARAGARTLDRQVKSLTLYRLSYPGLVKEENETCTTMSFQLNNFFIVPFSLKEFLDAGQSKRHLQEPVFVCLLFFCLSVVISLRSVLSALLSIMQHCSALIQPSLAQQE